MIPTEGFRVRGWSVAKRSETKNDDAWGYCNTSQRVAVADGVTMASYSGLWAGILVRGFIDGKLDIPSNKSCFEEQIAQLQAEWHNGVPWERLTIKGYPFDFKAKQGGFSTLLGMEMKDDHWAAFAIGDCNLFVVDYKHEVKCSWPAQDWTEFGTLPVSIRSVPSKTCNDPHSPHSVFDSIPTAEGDLQPGDSIVVCTDAMAAFLLGNKFNKRLWWEFLALDNASGRDFAAFIDESRRQGLKNDDSTAVVLEMP